MSVLVTGGAGYIGSHVAHALTDVGETVVVLDDLSSGNRAYIPSAAHFYEGSAGNAALVQRIMSDHCVQAVLHFAGSIVVPESIEMPLKYYENNTAVSRILIEACVASNVGQFVFSSTAAVYGETAVHPVREFDTTRPLSPYGRSKRMVEWILEDTAQAHEFRYVALRYFNVAGVDTTIGAGQPDRKVPHLIKRAAQVALGKVMELDVYGTDYPTPDGTAVRDYIHINDLANAHLLSLAHLRKGGVGGVYNVGYGRGVSVLEVISAFERSTGRPLPISRKGRRVGDAPSVVADSSRLRKELEWAPRFDRLELMVASSMEWERRLALARMD
jgi:UDP-glucose 4-epimerase